MIMPWCSSVVWNEGDRRLLAAVLGGGAGEDAADLADQRARHPQAAGLVEEVAHLGAMLPNRVGVPKMMAS